MRSRSRSRSKEKKIRKFKDGVGKSRERSRDSSRNLKDYRERERERRPEKTKHGRVDNYRFSGERVFSPSKKSKYQDRDSRDTSSRNIKQKDRESTGRPDHKKRSKLDELNQRVRIQNPFF
jgi:hypothetical protein